jgi:hypothetical protein
MSGTSDLSVREMARRLNVAKSQVARDKLAGMPMHDADSARAWRLAHRDVSRTKEGRIDRPAMPPESQPAAQANRQAPPLATDLHRQIEVEVVTAAENEPALADSDAPQSTDTAEYRAARALRERIRAEREQLELNRLRGSLADVEEVARIAYTAYRALRDAILNVPARIKDQLAAEEDPFRTEQVIEAELTSVLSAFDPASAVREKEDDDEA